MPPTWASSCLEAFFSQTHITRLCNAFQPPFLRPCAFRAKALPFEDGPFGRLSPPYIGVPPLSSPPQHFCGCESSPCASLFTRLVPAFQACWGIASFSCRCRAPPSMMFWAFGCYALRSSDQEMTFLNQDFLLLDKYLAVFGDVVFFFQRRPALGGGGR